MTKQEYMIQLEKELQALSSEERVDALKYYEEYFDDAGDGNERTVMEELGTPQKLGAYLCRNSSCVLSNPEGKDDKKASSENGIRGIIGKIELADLVFRSGDSFHVETKNLDEDDYKCEIDRSGILRIESGHKGYMSFFPFSVFSQNRQLIVTIPGEPDFEILYLEMGAGTFKTEDCRLVSEKTKVHIGAGNCKIGSIKTGDFIFKCGMGDMTIRGTLTGCGKMECGMGNFDFNGILEADSDVKCGMGNMTLHIAGNRDSFQVNTHCGVGSIKVDDSDHGRTTVNDGKRYRLDADCGMGNISVRFGTFSD